jgi:cbb3-type cytochrome c oxidase subunit III
VNGPLRITVGGLLLAVVIVAASCQSKPKVEPAAVESKASAESLATLASLRRGQEAFLAHCAMCHGDAGNGDGDMAPVIRKRSGVNVARLNDREVLGRLTRAEVVAVIEKGGAHTGRSNLMPAWGSMLDHAQIEDIAGYVMTLADSSPAIPRTTLADYLAAPAGAPAEGRVLFVHHCSGCHGPFAKGDGPLADRLWAAHHVRPRNLTDSSYIATKTDQQLFAVISLGGGHFRKAVQMPAWTVTLTPAQIKSVVAYVRQVSHTAPRI